MRIEFANVFEDIRRLPGVDAELARIASECAAGAASGGRGEYAHGVEAGATRSRGYVVTADYDAMVDNARDHTLLRGLNAVS